MREYKHITVLAKPHPTDPKLVMLLVYRITHVGSEFGDKGLNWWNDSETKISLGVDSHTPGHYFALSKSPWLFFDTNRIINVINMPAHLWPTFKKAIENYNAYYSGKSEEVAKE
jgi:hypothetical protein